MINVWVFKIGQEALLLCTKAECSICSMNNTFLASYILDSRMIVGIKICLDVPFQERSYLITNNRHDKLYKLLIQVSISIFSFNPPASNHNYSFFFLILIHFWLANEQSELIIKTCSMNTADIHLIVWQNFAVESFNLEHQIHTNRITTNTIFTEHINIFVLNDI